jgi:hypothetical protein
MVGMSGTDMSEATFDERRQSARPLTHTRDIRIRKTLTALAQCIKEFNPQWLELLSNQPQNSENSAPIVEFLG